MILPVLIISADSAHRDALASITSSCGLRAIGCGTFSGAKYFLAHQQFTAVLYELAENDELGRMIKEVADFAGQTPIVVVSRMDNWDSYLSAIAAGAFDYVGFPP